MAKRKAAAGSGSLRQRPNGTWEARYQAGTDPATGKPIRRSVYGKTQKEVREKLRAATAAVDEGTYFEPKKLTLAQWLEEWLATYTRDLKPLTLDAYRRQARNNIIPYLGAVPLAALSAPQIQKLYNTLLEGGARKPLSPKTIRNLHGVLHKALKQAVLVDYIRSNPADAVVVPRVEKTEIKPLVGAQVSAFLEAIRGDDFELVYMIDLYTGMRQGEILGLTWDCVNAARRQITVKQQLQQSKEKGAAYYFAPLKNNRTRVITVAPTVMALLSERKAAQAQQMLVAGALWDATGQMHTDSKCTALCRDARLVFTDGLGRHLAINTVYKHFKRIVAGIGLDAARFHDLRHSFATASLENGDDIKTVQQALGHATASFTLDVYGHVSEQMQEDSAQRMEEYIRRVAKGR